MASDMGREAGGEARGAERGLSPKGGQMLPGGAAHVEALAELPLVSKATGGIVVT